MFSTEDYKSIASLVTDITKPYNRYIGRLLKRMKVVEAALGIEPEQEADDANEEPRAASNALEAEIEGLRKRVAGLETRALELKSLERARRARELAQGDADD